VSYKSGQKSPAAFTRKRILRSLTGAVCDCVIGHAGAGVPLLDRPQKILPGRQFTGKNPPRPAAARAGRIFAGKSSAGGDFSVRQSYNGGTFYGADDISIRGRHIKSVIISPRADFSWDRHFDVTPETHGIR